MIFVNVTAFCSIFKICNYALCEPIVIGITMTESQKDESQHNLSEFYEYNQKYKIKCAPFPCSPEPRGGKHGRSRVTFNDVYTHSHKETFYGKEQCASKKTPI